MVSCQLAGDEGIHLIEDLPPTPRYAPSRWHLDRLPRREASLSGRVSHKTPCGRGEPPFPLGPSSLFISRHPRSRWTDVGWV